MDEGRHKILLPFVLSFLKNMIDRKK